MIEPIRVSGLSDDDNRLVNMLLRQLGDKLPRNLLRETYYDSKRVGKQISSVVPPQYHRMGVALGWAAKTVDGLAARCNLDGFVWPDGDIDDLGIRELLDQNRFESQFRGGRTTAMLYGPAFIVNRPGFPAASFSSRGGWLYAEEDRSRGQRAGAADGVRAPG